MCKSIERCHTSREVESYLASRGATKIRQCGSHAMWRASSGALVIIPCHAGNLKRGTLSSIVKMIVAAGLGLLFAVCYLVASLPHL